MLWSWTCEKKKKKKININKLESLKNTKIRNIETVGVTETGKTLDHKQYLSFQTEFKLEFDV